MSWQRIHKIMNSLQAGYEAKIPIEFIRAAAIEDLPALDRMAGYRVEDIDRVMARLGSGKKFYAHNIGVDCVVVGRRCPDPESWLFR